MYMIGVLTTGVFGFVYFALLNTAIPGLIFLAIMLSLIPHDMMYGPQAALIAESFTGRLRYSGASLGYQLASIIAGGPAPLIATALFAHYKSGYAIALYILACSVVSLVAAACLKDYTNKDISEEYGETHPAPAAVRRSNVLGLSGFRDRGTEAICLRLTDLPPVFRVARAALQFEPIQRGPC